MSHKYEVERVDLKAKITDLMLRINFLGNTQKGKDIFISAIRKFMQLEKLTTPLVQEFIDRIDVYETESTGKNRTHRVFIYYRFVGYLELPYEYDDFFSNDLRQGIAITYILRETKSA